jgi:HPt (histidine-containing phosphotransfer) domain-containing protein
MIDTPTTEYISPDLEELMERFFASSRKDLDLMRAALDAEDYPTLARMGHTAKGTGYGYGFRGMGDIGLELEGAAVQRKAGQCRALVERMARYLATVQVKFTR